MSIESLFKARSFVFDIECEADSHDKKDNLNYLKAKPVCIAFAWQHEGQLCSEVLSWEEMRLKCLDFEISAMMQDPNIKKCGQNIKFDAKIWQHNIGQRVNGIYFDTVVAAKLIDENTEHNMEALSMLYLGEAIKYA